MQEFFLNHPALVDSGADGSVGEVCFLRGIILELDFLKLIMIKSGLLKPVRGYDR